MKYLKKFNEEYSSQTYVKIARCITKKAKDLPTSTFRERSIKTNLENRAQKIKDHAKFIENIEKFNEEHDSKTYYKYAKELKSLGHDNRSSRMEEWAKEVEIKEKEIEEEEKRKEKEAAYKKTLDEVKDFGLFDITVIGRKGDLFSGKFYLETCLESDWFKDMRRDWLSEDMDWSLGINMEFAIIPSDDETLKMIESSEDEEVKYHQNQMWGDYKYWMNRLWITLFKRDLVPSFKVHEFEGKDGISFRFNSRKESIRFKKLLVSTFEGTSNWGYWKNKTIADQFKDSVVLDEEGWRKLLMDNYLRGKDNADELLLSKGIMVDDPDTWPKNPFTGDVYDKSLDAIKRMSLNGLYRD